MIAPGNSGHRSQAIARDAARQVSARKYGIRLTWILPVQQSLAGRRWAVVVRTRLRCLDAAKAATGLSGARGALCPSRRAQPRAASMISAT